MPEGMTEREWACFEQGVNWERDRVAKVIESKEWVGETLAEDVANLLTAVKGQQIDHLGEAIRATAWAYTGGERPNPLIKGEK